MVQSRESIDTVKLIFKKEKMSVNDVKLSSQSLENGEQIINLLVSQKKKNYHTHTNTLAHTKYIFHFTKDRKISQKPHKIRDQNRIKHRIPYGISLRIKGKKNMNLGVDFGLSP